MATLAQRTGAGMLALFVTAGSAMAQAPVPASLQQDAKDGATLCKLKPEEMLKAYRESAVHAVRLDKNKIIASVPGADGKRSEVALDDKTFAQLAMSAAQIPQPGPHCPTV